jgi:ABC-type transport system involved in multi-copper enzyme maturation permease subunit
VNREPLRLPPYPLPRRGPEPPSGWHLFGGWLRRELAPSAFRRAWRPRLGAAAVLAGVVALAWHGGRLATWQQAALWGVLLAAAAVLTRRGWLRLFGPVLFYDLVRTGRQGRAFQLRAAYAFALLAALSMLYATYFGREDPFGVLFGEARAATTDVAEFGSKFFVTFLGLQFGAVFVLTPAFTATAVAEEKERRTLEYLLATDLENREIVLGKLASRLLALLLLLLGGLPVLSFVQFLGGVDPNLVLAGFAATAVTMLSLGSLGILNSVYATRPRGAIFSTYVEAGAYLLISTCCAPAALSSGGSNPLAWPAAGNVFVAYAAVTSGAAAAGGTTGSSVLSVLSEYVVFHTLAAVLLTGWATLKLRSWNREVRPKSEREAVAALRAGRPTHWARPRLPRVGSDPVLWKELYAEHAYRVGKLARGLLTFAGGGLLAVAGLWYLCGLAMSLADPKTTSFAGDWVRVVGTSVACLMIVAVAVRASTGLGSERDRQTLDGLLTTPLSNASILRAKWLGALLSVRAAWGCLGAVLLLGFLAGGLHVLSLLLLVASWWAFAAFAAGLGLWFSLHCRTTLRATVWTLMTLLVVTLTPFVACGAGPGLLVAFSSRRLIDLSALTPPGAMAYLAFGWGDWYSFDSRMKSSLGEVCLAWGSACAYALAAVALWFGIGARFGRVTGRMPHR